MHSSILLLAAFSAQSLAIAIAKPYDPLASWDEVPGLEAFNFKLPLAETTPVITPNLKPIEAPVASPLSTCGFPNRLACCTTNDYNGCHDADYTSFCSGKPLVCCSRVDITSQIGVGCQPLTPALPAVETPQKLDTTEGEGSQESITGEKNPTIPIQVPVPVPNVPGDAVPEPNKEEPNPIWWQQE